jgi:hypothetical protein
MKVEFSDCDTRPSDNVNVEHLIEQIIGNTNDSLQEAGVKKQVAKPAIAATSENVLEDSSSKHVLISANNETRIQIVCDEEERSEYENEGNTTKGESMTKFWLVSTVVINLSIYLAPYVAKHYF